MWLIDSDERSCHHPHIDIGGDQGKGANPRGYHKVQQGDASESKSIIQETKGKDRGETRKNDNFPALLRESQIEGLKLLIVGQFNCQPAPKRISGEQKGYR